jgi:hypothetical protein
MFNNQGELLFRMKEPDEDFTSVVGTFAAGTWSSCVRVIEEEARSQSSEPQPES